MSPAKGKRGARVAAPPPQNNARFDEGMRNGIKKPPPITAAARTLCECATVL